MRYLRLLGRERTILLLWLAQGLSIWGDRLYAVAVMWAAWKESGAVAMGLVAVAESVPYIVVGTMSRRVGERFQELRALALVDVARAVLVAALPLCWHLAGIPGLLVGAALVGLGGAVFDPQLGAAIPDLVRPEDVAATVGAMDLTGRIARIAGPGAAGALLAVFPAGVLFPIDGVTFVVSAASLAAISRRRARIGAGPGAGGPVGPVGVREALRAHPHAGVLLGMHTVGIVAGAASMAMPALLASRLHAGAGTYGAVMAASGAGGLAVHLVLSHVRLPQALAAGYCVAWLANGALLVATGVSATLPVLIVVSVASGAVAPVLGVLLGTWIARHPAPVRRRLLTVDQTLIRTGGTLSLLAVPGFAAAAPAVGYAVAGVLTIVAAGLGWLLVVRRPVPPSELASDLSSDLSSDLALDVSLELSREPVDGDRAEIAGPERDRRVPAG